MSFIMFSKTLNWSNLHRNPAQKSKAAQPLSLSPGTAVEVSEECVSAVERKTSSFATADS